MKTAKKKSKIKRRKKFKITPIYLPNGDIHDADELMIKYDFDNDPAFKAKREKAIEDLRNDPPPEWFLRGRKLP